MESDFNEKDAAHVDSYKWTFNPVGGSTETYTTEDDEPLDLSLSALERGTISVSAYNEHCDMTSDARTATIERKLPWPSWTDTKSPLCNSTSYEFKYSSVTDATSYLVETNNGLVVWDWTSYSWATSTTQSGTAVYIKAPSTGNGNGTITVKAQRTGILSSDARSYTIWYGKPDQPTTDPGPYPDIQMDVDDRITIYVTSAPGADPYGFTWTATGSIRTTSNPHLSFIMIEATSPGYGYFYCTAGNDCGTSTAAWGTVFVSSYKGYVGPLKVYPNPADSYVVLEVDETKLDISEQSVSEQLKELSKNAYIRIIDKSGIIKISEPYYGEEKVQLDVSKLLAGLYTIQLVTSKEAYSTNLSISR